MRSNCVIQFVGAQHLAVIPSFQYMGHHFFDVVQVLLRLQRVVDAVVALLVKLGVGNVGVVAEMCAPRGLDQAVRH